MVYNAKYIFTKELSYIGLFIGGLFLALSLTPSLLPRTWLFQGIVSGLSLISGYGIGAVISLVWNYLELPLIPDKYQKHARYFSLAIVLFCILYFLSKTGDWQNKLHELAGIDEINHTYPFRTLAVSILLGSIILLFLRFIILISNKILSIVIKYLPRRYGRFIGILLLLWLYGSLMSGILTRKVTSIVSSSYAVTDITTDPQAKQPASGLKSGSIDSYATWETLGRQGRNFVSTGPSQSDIAKVTGNESAKEPIRVYAGLKSADSIKERAELLLNELIRTNAFERKLLVVTTATGTGWVDPNGSDSLEYIHNGDTAIASMQYSYLPSWISLLSDDGSTKNASITMFNTIHEYWQKLDKDNRPKLYLYGISLGAYGSEAAASWISLTNDPIDGALWVGPPFVNEFKNQIISDRDKGSTVWLPVYRNGSVIRFTGQENSLYKTTEIWKDNRFIYLQYGSDPVALFSVDSFYKEPEWLKGNRAPDVSSDMKWYPGVTFWQLLADILNGENMPYGYGHSYSTDSYINSWVALTQPEDWNIEKELEIKNVFKNRIKPID